MKHIIWRTAVGTIIFAMLLGACVYRPAPGGPSNAEQQQTAVIETITSRLTEQALETVVAQATEKVLPAETSQSPTETSLPSVGTETSTVSTATQIPPSQTPVVPTATPVIPTSTQVPTVAVTPIVSPTDWAQ